MTHAAVMVVEDDPALREALCDTLDLAGYRSLPAADGQAALALLGRERPALVVSDVQMQPMDGNALLHALRRQRPDLPVVLMTAFGTICTARAQGPAVRSRPVATRTPQVVGMAAPVRNSCDRAPPSGAIFGR